MGRLLPWLLVLGLMMFLASDAEAQCVMCKAVAEDSAEDGSLGRGLNSGILYLMAFFAWFVFRKPKEKGEINGERAAQT